MEKYGGILLSFDVIVTKPFTDLMNNSFVMDAKQSLLGLNFSEFLREKVKQIFQFSFEMKIN